MATVTIDGNDYQVYADIDAADERLNADIAADDWRDADADTKARALVTSTRWIDSVCWIDTYDTFEKRLAEPKFVNASIDLASLLVSNPTLMRDMTGGGAVTTDGGTKRLKAGSVEIEYFYKFSALYSSGGTGNPFPPGIMALLGAWLCEDTSSGASVAGSWSSGTCYPSRFKRDQFGFYEGL